HGRARDRPGPPPAANDREAPPRYGGDARRERNARRRLPHSRLGGLRDPRGQRDRQYGSGSFQVVRRLRAMLENLIASLPEIRRPPLEVQMRMLERSVERDFPDAEDRASAAAADSQGLGHVE